LLYLFLTYNSREMLPRKLITSLSVGYLTWHVCFTLLTFLSVGYLDDKFIDTKYIYLTLIGIYGFRFREFRAFGGKKCKIVLKSILYVSREIS
jgi:hypothetical protein